jgi:hypothetical protein
MATAVTTTPLSGRMMVDMVDFDPDVTTVAAAIKASTWYDMRDYGSVMAKFMRTIGTSAFTFDIAVSAAASGSNPVAVKAHAVGSEPDAVEDQIFIEVTAEQCLEVLANGRYVAARASFATGTDEGVVAYVFGNPKRARRGLTADVVA